MATANTFVQIGSTVTVGSGGAATITFSSIPATYTDLKLVMSARSSDSANRFQSINLSINGVTTNRTVRYLYGDGTNTNSVSSSGAYAGQTNAGVTTASCFSNNEWYFPNYAGSNYKSFSSDQVGESNETRGDDYLLALLWSSADAITSLAFSSASGNWVEYSTASLYGILKY